MKEWIFKSFTNNDWIFFICYFNFLTFASLKWFFPKKISQLPNILFLNTNLKTSVNKCFSIEPFNVGSFLIISSSLSLLFYHFLLYFKNSFLTLYDFLFIFLIISITLTLRFFLVRSIFSIFSKIDDIEPFLSKKFSQSTILCMYILIIIFINEYSFLNKKLISAFFILIFLTWVIFNCLLIYRYLKNRRNEFLYLIFYICAVKISPWLWIYHSIYYTKIQV